MRMLCINDSGWVKDKSCLWGIFKWEKIVKGPKYGDIVTRIGQLYVDGMLCYTLLEWPKDNEGFEADCFIPLSEIDEIEMERNYQIKKITI